MNTELQFPWQQDAVIRQSQRLINSFHHWTGRSLIDISGSPMEIAQALFEAPFAVLSHNTESDPILNYGNRKALELWEMDWNQFTRLPSRYSAEPMEREERLRLLNQVTTQGYINNYQGVRISSTGKRFQISDVIVWNLIDEENNYCGQGATFSQWIPIN
ncbi:MEKHLA domain-containing protein [Moorena producens JHB]|uniref:MEKHLA domain-containing protein n=1 Tax=Moorena producens (strain JHB) TaxID=1454205 RepID=A0A1D9FTH2_MOOP1|nr:MEKHLA domain-containing protein [Moorena producens]AOY78669.1 MEKHLA domain-containing protein [Moorena producens JHB]